MADRDETGSTGPVRALPAGYEPPRVELVVTAADLEREVLYAGVSV